jgi:CheY-like chemotaxis protein
MLMYIIVQGKDGTSKKPEEEKSAIEEMTNWETLAQIYPLKILLAEDYPINQKLALKILEKLGYHADLAGNGLEALAALEKKSYDIILMDVQMPEMDGVEATKRIAEKYSPNIRPKIIAMTANAIQGDREKYISLGMDDYVSKPISLQIVAKTLERWGESLGKKVHLPQETSQSKQEEERLEHQTLFPQEKSNSSSTPDYSAQMLIQESAIEDLKMVDGDGEPEFMREILGDFISQTPTEIHEILKALEDGQRDALKAVSHKLKGTSRQVGAVRLAMICEELEKKALSDDMEHLKKNSESLQKIYHETCTALEKIRTVG